jgi:hypothetical protein
MAKVLAKILFEMISKLLSPLNSLRRARELPILMSMTMPPTHGESVRMVSLIAALGRLAQLAQISPR